MNFDQKLLKAAEGWLKARAPFATRGRSKRFGVDCANLAHAIYTEAGVDLPPVPHDYFVDESRHARTQRLINWIEESGMFEEVPVGGYYKPGTMLCAKIGLAPYHVALVFAPGRVIHAVRRPGVCAVSIGDPVLDNVTKAYMVKYDG